MLLTLYEDYTNDNIECVFITCLDSFFYLQVVYTVCIGGPPVCMPMYIKPIGHLGVTSDNRPYIYVIYIQYVH